MLCGRASIVVYVYSFMSHALCLMGPHHHPVRGAFRSPYTLARALRSLFKGGPAAWEERLLMPGHRCCGLDGALGWRESLCTGVSDVVCLECRAVTWHRLVLCVSIGVGYVLRVVPISLSLL